MSWRHLLGSDVAQGSSFETERLKKACVVGAGKLGSSLAETLVAKPGLAQVAVHMSVGGTDTKFDIMPVRFSNLFLFLHTCRFSSLVCAVLNSNHAQIRCMWRLGALTRNLGTLQIDVDSASHYVQGVSVIQRAKDACKWAQLLFFCCSYEECRQFLRSPGVNQALKGKCVVQLCSGTPEEANQMATWVQQLGATYLDAVILV